MKHIFRFIIKLFSIAPLGVGIFLFLSAFGQGDARVVSRIDARQITVGDQARVFLEVQSNPATTHLQWAVIPDTFNHLEIVERGKIDTFKVGAVTTYRQRLVITGFDSGEFKIPAFVFPVIPVSGTAYTIQSDSFALVVQTVAVDTTKGFKPIKGIMFVNTTWRDYIPYIVGGGVALLLAAIIIIYFATRKKKVSKPKGPVESLTDYTLRMLRELDTKQLWQKNRVKEYYVDLTDLVRNYIEARFETQVMELTTDELLYKVQLTPELQQYYTVLSDLLHTADLAKFAKAQPLPQEHTDAMQKAKDFVASSRPVIIVTSPDNNGKPNELTADNQ